MMALLLYRYSSTSYDVQDADSDTARKKAAADALRAQEKFMMIGTGEAQCKGCGYTYDPKLGDPEYPVSKGVKFEVRYAALRLHPVGPPQTSSPNLNNITGAPRRLAVPRVWCRANPV